MPRVMVQARVTVVEWLMERGLYRGTAGNAMRLGLCSRSGDVIEPVLKPQWWVDMKDMAAAAVAAAKDKRLTIIPAEFEATWFRCAASPTVKHGFLPVKSAGRQSHLIYPMLALPPW